MSRTRQRSRSEDGGPGRAASAARRTRAAADGTRRGRRRRAAPRRHAASSSPRGSMSVSGHVAAAIGAEMPAGVGAGGRRRDRHLPRDHGRSPTVSAPRTASRKARSRAASFRPGARSTPLETSTACGRTAAMASGHVRRGRAPPPASGSAPRREAGATRPSRTRRPVPPGRTVSPHEARVDDQRRHLALVTQRLVVRESRRHPDRLERPPGQVREPPPDGSSPWSWRRSSPTTSARRAISSRRRVYEDADPSHEGRKLARATSAARARSTRRAGSSGRRRTPRRRRPPPPPAARPPAS